ncbi:MAG: BatD family protein [Candidatus Zixiibacteriota bacterium]
MSARTGRLSRALVLGWLIGALMCLVGVSAFAQSGDDVSIQVSLSPDTIGMDGQAALEVQVTGSSQSIPDLEMPSLPAFEIYGQGRSTSINIVNGKVSASVAYRYLLMPQKPGVFPIDGIALVYNNKRYTGNVVTLTVLNKGQSTSPKLEQRATTDDGGSKDLFLVASVDNKSPYVNQQVTLTLKFYLGVQSYSSPQLNEPATTGFWAEPLGNSAPYMERVKGRNYRVFEIKYALFPTQSGEMTIGRATVTTTVATRAPQRDPFDMFGDLMTRGEQVTVRSEPLTVQVRALPTAGRPSDFGGSIGKFNMEAKPDKTEVEMNQPVTLNIKINGQGNIKSVAEPTIPELKDFRVYRASSNENVAKMGDRVGGTKTFEEVFIPKRPGILEIPALSLTYFNPDAGKYETISTKPVSMNVKKPEGYVNSPDIPYSGPNMTLGSEAQDIRFIKPDLGPVNPIGQLVLFNPLYLLVNALPIAVLAGLIVVRKRKERMSTDVGWARSRGASKMAKKRLAKARSLANVSQVREFYGELSLALTAYIADKLNISPYGLTSDQIADLLRQKGSDEQLVTESVAFLRTCDFARFAPANLNQSDITTALATAEQLMVRIEGVRFA